METKNAPAARSNESAVEQRHCISLTPIQVTLLVALLRRPVSREEADRLCHVSNSPDVVCRLRRKAINIHMEKVAFVKHDGKRGWYGRYWIDSADKPAVRQLLPEVRQ